MINFNSYYSFPAAEVSYVSAEQGNSDLPYTLTVHLKSGQGLRINYENKDMRDREKQILVTKIENELRSHTDNLDQISNRVYLVEDCVRRIDKRQLKIWRQLKALLGLKDEQSIEESS